MELQGKIKLIGETKTFGANGFQKRELVVTTEEQYPQHVLIEFVQEKTNLLDAMSPGDQVKIGINLRGREWQDPKGETKYFNSIQGWRIEKLGSNQTTDTPPAYQAPENTQEEEDDIPF